MGLKISVLLGWGVVIYAVMFLLWSVFVTYGFIEGFVPRVLGLLILIGLGIVAGKALRAHSWRDILPYSLAWGIMMAIFDAVMSVPFGGWHIFLDWNAWFVYAAVVLSPLLALYPQFQRFPTVRGFGV